MINTVATAKPWTEPGAERASVSPSPPAPSTHADPATSQHASSSGGATQAKPDVRLMIEEDKDNGTFIYKLVDSVTGKTLTEIPHEQMSQLGDSDTYAAGDVLSTSA